MTRIGCRARFQVLCLLLALLGTVAVAAAASDAAPLHGLWIRHSALVLQQADAATAIRGFCARAGITEVYLAVPRQLASIDELRMTQLIALLHESGIRVEALISSIDGDQAGAGRTRLLERVQSVLRFNRRNGARSFDGIHLDIEPQQRAENRDSLQFLPALIDSYRTVRILTDRAGLTLNADLSGDVVQADLELRRALLRALPRITVSLHDRGTAPAQLRERAAALLSALYSGLESPDSSSQPLGRSIIGLHTTDFGASLPQALATLDEAGRADPHYLGWAQDSYNETLKIVEP